MRKSLLLSGWLALVALAGPINLHAVTSARSPESATLIAQRAALGWLDGPETDLLARPEAEAFVQLRLRDVQAESGRMLRIGEKTAFVLAKHKLKRDLRKSTTRDAFARDGNNEGFGLGFLLGFLLGLIGVLIAYLALRDSKPGAVRGSWFGLGAVVVLVVILNVIAAS